MEDHQGAVTERRDGETGARLRAETPAWVNPLAQRSFGGEGFQRSQTLQRAGTGTWRVHHITLSWFLCVILKFLGI